MLHVIAPAHQLHQVQIARHHQVLGDAWNARQACAGRPLSLVHDAAGTHVEILGVLNEGKVEVLRITQGTSHQLGALHWPAVVREAHDAGARELPELGQLLAV